MERFDAVIQITAFGFSVQEILELDFAHVGVRIKCAIAEFDMKSIRGWVMPDGMNVRTGNWNASHTNAF